MEYPVLAPLPAADRRRFLQRCVRRTFERGEVIFHEGDPGDTLHLIESGRVAFRVITPMGDRVTLSVAGPGQYFGELALMTGAGRRTATAICLECVETRAMARTVFDDLCRSHPGVASLIRSALAGRIERLSALLLEAMFVSSDRRVLRRLLELADLEMSPDGATVRVTQDDLAGLAGTTRSTVNRTLKAVERAGLLQLGRGRVVVRDPEGLRRRAG